MLADYAASNGESASGDSIGNKYLMHEGGKNKNEKI